MTRHNSTIEQSVETKDDEYPGSSTNGHSPEPGIDWKQAQKGTRLILEAMGEDADSAPFCETWERRVPAMLETLSEGNRPEEKPEMRTFEADGEDLVVKTGVTFQSLCEHHLIPYTGTAHIAYQPNGTVVGLSKLIRYVRWQSRKPSIQEGLTRDIADGIAEELNAKKVVVELSATHLCEVMRGVESETVTTTRSMVGDLNEAERQRFENAIQRASD